MNCITCSQPLYSQKSDFTVCPNCGTVNLLSSTDTSLQQRSNSSVVSPTIESLSNDSPHLSKVKLIGGGVSGLGLLLFLSLGGFLLHQNSQATSLLHAAQHNIGSGNYESALKQLYSAQGKYSFSNVHKQIINLEIQDKTWISDNHKLQRATQLSAQGKYSQATDQLAGIEKNFPGYDKVLALSASIIKKLDTTPKITPVATSTPAPQTTTTSTNSSKPKAAPVPAYTSPQAPTGPNLGDVVASINQKIQPFGVTATLSPPNNQYTYSTWTTLDSADANNLQQFASYLTEEFSKYPKDLITNSGLKTIGLVKHLLVSGGPRAATPAPSITGMLYDINVEDKAGSAYAREVVSHEYWHYLDYKMQGSYSYPDSTWSSCNTAGFTYGSGGASAYGSGYNGSYHPQLGFISQYATYAIEEDRAEMFGWLIYSPSSVKNLNDSNLNCKITRLTQIVHQLSPSMNF